MRLFGTLGCESECIDQGMSFVYENLKIAPVSSHDIIHTLEKVM